MTDLLAPIPLRPAESATSSGYHAIPFDREDPRWSEPLVALADYGLPVEAWYARSDGGNAPYFMRIKGAVETVAARKSAVECLVRADAAVQPLGLRIKALDAWRSVDCQKGLWEHAWDESLKTRPDLNEEERLTFMRTFVSDPWRFDKDDETTWPIHSTGGSIDVVLIDAQSGEILDHGAGFDEGHERSYTDHYERLLAAGEIGEDHVGLRNRRILFNAMVNAGFTNYVYEFWHFDFGTQAHVLTRRNNGSAGPSLKAWYGTTTLPEGMS